MQNSDGRKGAVPGKHQVTITWSGVPDEQAGDAAAKGDEKPSAKPMEPPKEADVNATGENTFTFEVGS